MAFNPATLDTRQASDEGVWFTLTDIEGNEIFEDKKPVQLHLYGKDGAVAKEALNEIMASGDADKVSAIAKMIKGWSDNLSAETADELAAIPHIAAWVTSKVIDRANFTPKG